MKPEIHPKYEKTVFVCTCGNTFESRSVMGPTLNIEICSQCHPFFTGKQKIMDTAGRVERFQKKYARGVAAAKPKKVKA